MAEQREPRLSEATREAERRQANMAGRADRPPTDDEERAAEAFDLDPDVAEHEREMVERGAHQKGEGRID
jgi:hypothetical protein